MSEINVSEIKNTLSSAKERLLEFARLRLPDHSEYSQRLANRRAMGTFLESYFTKAGVDVDKLNKMHAQNQSELRLILQERRAKLAEHLPSLEATFHHGIESRRRALELLATPINPFFVTLDKPFLIWQKPIWDEPNFGMIDSHIESFNSFAKIQMDTNRGSRSTNFSFDFLWENQSDYNAVVNVETSLVLNGICKVGAGKGIFSGDSADLNVSDTLLPWEYWTQPPTCPMGQQSQSHSLVQFHVEGGGVFGDNDSKGQTFAFTPSDLSFNFFLVPPRSLAVIEVDLVIQYNFTGGGGDINDFVQVDLTVLCPSVELELRVVTKQI
jgi:hypothetical protein